MALAVKADHLRNGSKTEVRRLPHCVRSSLNSKDRGERRDISKGQRAMGHALNFPGTRKRWAR